jgi:hypothetical protein
MPQVEYSPKESLFIGKSGVSKVNNENKSDQV